MTDQERLRGRRISRMKRLSNQQALRPYKEIAAIWNARSGQTISTSRVHQILTRAERKIRDQLVAVAAEVLEVDR